MSQPITVATLSAEDVEKIMRGIESDENVGQLMPESAPASQVGDATTEPFLKEFVNAEQLKRDVNFNVADMDNATQQHAGMFAHYANQARLAARQYARMESAFEILESQLDHLWREHLVSPGAHNAGGIKKVTEAMIAAAVKADPRWWRGKQRVIDAKAIHELARKACDAFDHRRDMIIQTSVNQRKEREGQLRVMGHAGLKSAVELAGAAKQQGVAMVAGETTPSK